MIPYTENPKDANREVVKQSCKIQNSYTEICVWITTLTKDNKEKLKKQSIYYYIKKNSTLKTIRCWWKKPKMTSSDGNRDHVLGLKESIL